MKGRVKRVVKVFLWAQRVTVLLAESISWWEHRPCQGWWVREANEPIPSHWEHFLKGQISIPGHLPPQPEELPIGKPGLHFHFLDNFSS